jgi:hypothetical protein
MDIKLFDADGVELKVIRGVRYPNENFEKFWKPVFGAAYWEPFVEVPSVEARMVKIRKRRDMLLSKCDWTQGADTPLDEAQRAEWAEYRKALRDLTTEVNAASPTWPKDPNGNQ